MKLRRPATLDILLACGVAYAALVLCGVLCLYIPSIADVSLPVPDDELITRIEGMAMRGAVLCAISGAILSLCAAALIQRCVKPRSSAEGVQEGAGVSGGSKFRKQ